MKTLDCKDKIYMNLISNNYYDLKPNQKKILVCQELKNYLTNTINEYYKINSISERYEISDLINYLSNHSSMVPIILFIIHIMGESQGQKISWIIKSELTGTNIIIENNIIKRIESNEKYSLVFNYLFDYYLNDFDKEDNNVLIKKQEK